MSIGRRIRDVKLLRWPLLAASKVMLTPLVAGPAMLRRAVYDTMPVPYLVTGHHERYVVSTADKVIGWELFLHGEFDFAKLQTALAILEREGLPRPSHLIDVGANIGTIVIPALKRGLMQSATAIEPHPDNLRLLRANLALNDVSEQVRVLAQAVGAEPHAALFLVESSTNSGNHSIGSDGIPVPSSRLDDLDLPETGILLWMDIEGYEGHALSGASRMLSIGTPIVFEYNHSFLRESHGLGKLRTALVGYKLFDLNFCAHQKETNFDKLESAYVGRKDFTDILAIPYDKAV